VIGGDNVARTEVIKKLWDYIKANGLQDAANKRAINADAKLKPVFGKDQVTMFELAHRSAAATANPSADAASTPATQARKCLVNGRTVYTDQPCPAAVPKNRSKGHLRCCPRRSSAARGESRLRDMQASSEATMLGDAFLDA
jgi:hypothetical protein